MPQAAMIWFVVIAGVLSAWALLRLMGAERQRRLEALRWQLEREASDEPQEGRAALRMAAGLPPVITAADRGEPQPQTGAARV